ncbi:MAG: thiosulfate reductase, partial [Gammaproteobacteria bacterium]
IARIAREFATTKPATTFSYRGPCKQLYGAQNEAAIQMLNVITGNVEKKGGYCLPRGMGWPQPEPVPPHPEHHSLLHQPPEYPVAHHHVSTHTPYTIMKGDAKVSVWFTYYDNPVYTYPSSHVWEALLKDEKLVPFFVSMSPYMSETTELADLIIPDVTYLERHDPESMPSGLYPCLSIRQPVVKPLAGSQEFRQNLIDIIHKVDPDGSLGIRKYFAFNTPEEWMRAHLDNIPGLKEAGGFDFLKKHGVWPIYGEVDKETARIVDKNGNEVEPEYGLHMKELSAADMQGAEIRPDGAIVKNGKVIGRHIRGKNYVGFGTKTRLIQLYKDEYLKSGFDPLPTYKRDPRKDEMGDDELFLTTYKLNVHTQSRTASLKYLAELYHKNPAWINPKTAAKLGIRDGDLIRIQSHLGYMVTRAHVTEGIHPRCVAVSTACGHTAYGRFARLKHKEGKAQWGGQDSDDIRYNTWWDDHGVHPNRIIQMHVDPIGASQSWFHTPVKVMPAQSGDKYGDVVASVEAAIKDYEYTMRFSVGGDMHEKM